MDITFFTHAALAAAEETTKDPIALLGLDWKLFIAQLINFGIVVLVLWKWVFIPASRALEKRTKKIEDSLANADSIQKEKNEFESWKDGEILKSKKQASEIIKSAQDEAVAVKKSEIEAAKKEQFEIIENTKLRLRREQDVAVKNAKEEIADLIIVATEKIIKQKLNSEKDRELITKVIKEL